MDWIKVEDRLPEVGERVLAINTEEQKVCVFTAPVKGSWLYDNKPSTRWFEYIEVNSCIHFNRVTHWMPLPEPPKN